MWFNLLAGVTHLNIERNILEKFTSVVLVLNDLDSLLDAKVTPLQVVVLCT